MKRVIWLTVALAGAACSAEEPGRLPLGGEPVEVTYSAAQRAPVVESFPAAVVSDRTAEIATRMSGSVERVLVEVGSTVQVGQTLLVLDASDIGARVTAARSGVDLAERSYDRVASLATDGAASELELDQATAAVESARAMLAEAQAQEAYAVLKAPFSGVITHRNVDAGDLAGPGQPLLTLVSPGALKVVADLPAHRAGEIAAGDTVQVVIPGSGASAARVTRAVPALGQGSRTFRIEAVLSQPPAGVMPGSYARIEVRRSDAGPRWLPSDAVVSRGQLTGVYTLDADTLRLRWVRLGQERDGAVELLAGPLGYLAVVRRPTVDLFDGLRVSSAREEAFIVPGGSGSPDAGSDTEEVDG
jgi:RND family efflux transporter MFP subunit